MVIFLCESLEPERLLILVLDSTGNKVDLFIVILVDRLLHGWLARRLCKFSHSLRLVVDWRLTQLKS